jgi:hypothetical protein
VDGIAESDRQVTLALLAAVVQRMSAMPGQRNIVVVSDGFLVTLKFRREEMRLIEKLSLDAVQHMVVSRFPVIR